MNDMDERNTLSEGALRTALQLDPDERTARFDAAALVAAAEHRSPVEQLQRVIRAFALIGVSIGIEAALAVIAFNTLADLDLTEPAGLVLSLVAAVARRVVAIGQLTTEPAVAVAALAAVLFAVVYERSTGREPTRVRAS